MNHTTILNHLAEKFGYKSYLEIGVQNPDNNFNKIICPERVGVDPDRHPVEYAGTFRQLESNAFFNVNIDKFDLIFIDGLHHWRQVYLDILNAHLCLNKGGSIVIHDLLPTSEEMQAVPRTAKEWTGDGWKAWLRAVDVIGHCYRLTNVIDSDYGVGVLVKSHFEQKVPNYDRFHTHMDRYTTNSANYISKLAFISSSNLIPNT